MNEENKGISIIIPAYNEENGIGKVLEKLINVMNKTEREYEIIVVDDGSTDNTGGTASLFNIRVIRHPKNLGYGKSILTGADHAKYDLLAITDADDTYDSEEIIKMLPMMDAFDMVIGKRDMTVMKQHFLVKILRFILKLIILYFTENFCPDPNSGLRMFRKSMLEGRDLFSLKFSFTTSITIYAYLTNKFIEYIPIKYYPRIGFSKVRHVRDSIRTLILIFSLTLIHRPLKCFMAHIIITLIGLVMIALTGILHFKICLFLTIIWLTVMTFSALGYIAFILGMIYTRINHEK